MLKIFIVIKATNASLAFYFGMLNKYKLLLEFLYSFQHNTKIICRIHHSRL